MSGLAPLDPRVNAVRSDLANIALKGRVEAHRFVEGERFQVTAARAPVMREPARDTLMLTEALRGESVTVFESRDGWAWGQLDADRYVGWLPAASLDRFDREPTRTVSVPSTLVFARADIKSPVLQAISLGARVTVIKEEVDRNAHYAMITGGGAIVRQHLTPISAPPERDWVAVAERFMRVPYLWGGKTSAGIDCSGLIQVALGACGVLAPRDTDMQEERVGAALSLENGLPELHRGDLIFWKGHVGFVSDPETLLHANAHHMAVAKEPLAGAVARLEKRGLPVTSIRRIVAD